MANYKVADTELTSIANAIRTKGGTSAQLEFPTGFVTAIGNIPSGGGGNAYFRRLEPLHTDVVGYVSSGDWHTGDNYCRSDVYKLETGKNYLIMLGAVVGNRFRVALFDTDVANATSAIGYTIANEDSAHEYQTLVKDRLINPMSYNGNEYLAIGKTNQGVDGIETYVFEALF